MTEFVLAVYVISFGLSLGLGAAIMRAPRHVDIDRLRREVSALSHENRRLRGELAMALNGVALGNVARDRLARLLKAQQDKEGQKS